MVKGQNKNKLFVKRKVNSSSVDNEYDLEKNIRKINSYSRNRKSHGHVTDSGEAEELCFIPVGGIRLIKDLCVKSCAYY